MTDALAGLLVMATTFFFTGMIVVALLLFLPQSPDPGYGYKWACAGDEVVIRYTTDGGGSYVAGQLCERKERG